jgi:hypothetical protein
MPALQEMLGIDAALRLECLRLSVQMVQAPGSRWDANTMITAARNMEAFVKGPQEGTQSS